MFTTCSGTLLVMEDTILEHEAAEAPFAEGDRQGTEERKEEKGRKNRKQKIKPFQTSMSLL
jgi:hypothetical protein